MIVTTFDEIKEEVMEAGGVKTFKVERLREAKGAGKMGPYVGKAISDALAQIGLGHYPPTMPTYSYDEVRVYALGSSVANLLRAAYAVGESNDIVLREAATNEASEILEQIRELVCY